ncbi:unnamed protein product [Kuraishia capsulata CBS 1993]|uniref:Potassium channel domain-containing protein n=1 Tax=Kuraishia capsulata CBS 1993 TaxID=1382522 RepID=W6MK48_9ASCO|nr:uncharacterized protein KUCA_T00002670001 [Kuraishia capsulata CBS 1993]CDK26696.1 unnamed protein product [Kuraishia capsulata CBS 1993]
MEIRQSSRARMEDSTHLQYTSGVEALLSPHTTLQSSPQVTQTSDDIANIGIDPEEDSGADPNVFLGEDEQAFEQTAPEQDLELGPYASNVIPDVKDYYRTLLNTNNWSIEDLAVKPGDRGFTIWFAMSSYFPLIAGCIGPVGNLMSLCAIICKWRVERETDKQVTDLGWMMKVNGISVMFGLISNISLLLNFRKSLRYTVSQVVSISGWFIAGCLLLALVISAKFTYFYSGSPYFPSEGYWFAVITVVLYFSCFTILLLNEVGFMLKKYPPLFNIDGVQKSLMTQSIALCIWLFWGAAVFAKLLDISFAEGIYFGVVTILTIGLGDFIPKTGVGMFVVLLWVTFGLVSFGLVISTIRELVIFSGSSTSHWHKVESARRKNFKSITAPLTSRESFEVMRKVTRLGSAEEKATSLLAIVSLWATFWLMGALVFHYVESWDYGVSCYFCFLCLVTIGYGTPSPITHGGRAFFVVWGLCAVPLMTILVSNLGDILFASLQDANNIKVIDRSLNWINRSWLSKWVLVRWTNRLLKKAEPGVDMTSKLETASSFNSDVLPPFVHGHLASHTHIREGICDDPSLEKLLKIQEILFHLKRSVTTLRKEPLKKYTFDEWNQMMNLVGRATKANQPLFWISDDSPFRFPFDEPQYFTFYYIHTLEVQLASLASELDRSHMKRHRE